MLPYLTFWCLSNFSFFHFAGKQALKYKAGRVRVNKAYSINIDNNLNKKWECLHHCWVRWIGISMKKAMFDKKQSVLEGEAMDDGRWMHIRLWWHQYACGRLLQGLVYAYVSLDKMAVARNLMCRTSLFCTWTLTDTERWSTKKGGEREREKEAADEDANLFPQALLFVSCALIVGFVQPLAEFLLLRGAPTKEHVIYKGIFKQGQEHKHKTAHEVDVDGFHVWNLWESLPKVGVNSGHGKHRCHTWVQQHTHTHTEKKHRDRQILHMYTLLLQAVLVYRYLLRGDRSGERSAQFTFI